MFTYFIKGITLTMEDMAQIHPYYEAACTAEYVMENYGITDDDNALAIGHEVRRQMDKFGWSEEEAISHVLSYWVGK